MNQTSIIVLLIITIISLLQIKPSISKLNINDVSPAYDVITRTFNSPDVKGYFELTIVASTNNKENIPQDKDNGIMKNDNNNSNTNKYFTIMANSKPSTTSKIKIAGTTVSELTAGVGYYLRQYCNMTIGWKRGGGSNIFIPKEWPAISETITMKRNAPYSYMMNVCTHSYSLVWYSWNDWERFIDWMALNGLNLVLAMTGQEEVQYKVFTKLGMKDEDIRSWFNGPAFLTWSRGQNEYGNNIAGPLPRSWMKQQWNLQKQILSRYRALGITGQLPGFQGNVPIQIKEIFNDANITQQGDTGWMDSLDPLFQKIADIWMETLIEDFDTDHWYQLDGYFNGGTAPWLENNEQQYKLSDKHRSYNSPRNNKNKNNNGNDDADDDDDISIDIMAYKRGGKAYEGLNHTDPNAIWSFQGWAFINWETIKQGSFIKAFVDSVPKDKFVVVDMSVNGEGEFHKWNDAAFFGAKFIWTTLHDFGGTDGMKGNLSQINLIPYDAPDNANVYGTGFTPEGIDQNPVYYEFMLDQNFRTSPVKDIPSYCSIRSHKRYHLDKFMPSVDNAWKLLCSSAYTQDLSVQDPTGVPHLPGSKSQFESDRFTPTPKLCMEFNAWKSLIDSSNAISEMYHNKTGSTLTLEPFRYDLINLGQELLSQVATPMSMNFSDAMKDSKLDETKLTEYGNLYIELLNDVDKLLSADPAFMIGPWLEMAKNFADDDDEHNGNNDDDCVAEGYPKVIGCQHFYEWNARVQLTTWNPTNATTSKIPSGPIDYASKHWSGLVKDYYSERATLLLNQALSNAKDNKPFTKEEMDLVRARFAHEWTISTNPYPTEPLVNYIDVSKEMHGKYEKYFSSCVG